MFNGLIDGLNSHTKYPKQAWDLEQMRLNRGVDAFQRVGIGRQRGQDPGHVHAHVRDARRRRAG